MTQGDYVTTGHGTNSQGNHWCTRDYGDRGTGIHYSNKDGSFYYDNPDGTKYHNNGAGRETLTTPDGRVIDVSKK
ncbi:hypothetical protein BDR04DRAFT_1091753 [Suillus decipiens]|nr:hypothetical protein BDR04DRAFT_1091753 [Suillus decipiens]